MASLFKKMLFCHVVITVCAHTFVTCTVICSFCTLIKINLSVSDQSIKISKAIFQA